MAVDDTTMDNILEVVLHARSIRVKNRDGAYIEGYDLGNSLTVRFADGSDAIIPSPLKNLEFHDGNANGLGHGAIVYRVEFTAADQGDGNVVHTDLSNP